MNTSCIFLSRFTVLMSKEVLCGKCDHHHLNQFDIYERHTLSLAHSVERCHYTRRRNSSV
jgi:hypothetical protein